MICIKADIPKELSNIDDELKYPVSTFIMTWKIVSLVTTPSAFIASNNTSGVKTSVLFKTFSALILLGEKI